MQNDNVPPIFMLIMLFFFFSCLLGSYYLIATVLNRVPGVPAIIDKHRFE